MSNKPLSKYALVERCSDETYWYADKIGQVFPLVRYGEIESYVKTGDSYNTGNYIQNADWELIYNRPVGEE
jgi:hypothetical protein